MNCKKCGNFCPDGHKFCLRCGAPLSQTVVNSDSTTGERPPNRLNFSGTTTDEAKKSTVMISGGIPISQGGGSFRVRQNYEQKSTNRSPEEESAPADFAHRPSFAPDPTTTGVLYSTPTPISEAHPKPTPAFCSELSPELPRKKWSVGLIILLILLILSFCGLAGVLLYHFGVIGDKSSNETTAQAEAPESEPEIKTDDKDKPSASSQPEEPPTPDFREGLLLRVDPVPMMAYAEKMISTENLYSCYLQDIDGDGLCEMILRHGNSEADMVFDFYTYQNGLTYLGQLSGGHSSMCVANGQLSRHYEQMGNEDFYAVILKDGMISEELIQSLQPADWEACATYYESTDTYEKNLGIFLSIHTEDLNQVAILSDYYVEKDGYFTNGQYTYQLLPNGTLWSIDAVNGTINVYQLTFSEYINLFAVTEKALFFKNTDPDRLGDWSWWGVEVFSLDKNTSARTDYGDGWNGHYENGYVFLTLFRSDVSPTTLTVIDSNDRMLLDKVDIWTYTLLDGAVYYYAIDAEAYNAWTPYSMTEYRLDSTGSTKIVEFSLEKGAYVYFPDAETVRITSCFDSEYTNFSVRTGEPIS